VGVIAAGRTRWHWPDEVNATNVVITIKLPFFGAAPMAATATTMAR
jgi:hypothetical protein